MRFRLTLVTAVVAALVLAGCSGTPEPQPTGSTPPVDATEQSTINGEWTLTRTVTASDDEANPAHAVDTVSTRAVQFFDSVCVKGPCTGSVLSGPTPAVRDTTTYASSGDVIRYEFTGFLNCLRQDTGTVLVANGYSYTTKVELTVIATDAEDAKKATTLEGTMTYTDTITSEAIEAGCTRTPLTATTEYALSAVRSVDATAAVPTP